MVNLETIPAELDFLKSVLGDRNLEYRKFKYLLTPFEAPTWLLDFGNAKPTMLDFRVKLENDTLLTDPSNHELLDTFKCWICIQGHFDVRGRVIYATSTIEALVKKVLILIDYFLINSDYFQLSRFGLKNVTENDIVELLSKLAQTKDTTTSIYAWPTRLTDYLRKELETADLQMLNRVIQENPFIEGDVPDEEDRMLFLTTEEIVLSRALLWSTGNYRIHYRDANNAGVFRHGPNTEKIANLIYVNTLRGKVKKAQPYELLLEPTYRYLQEYPRAAVRNNSDDVQSESEWRKFRQALRSLGLLTQIGLEIPIYALQPTKSLNTHESFLLRSKKHYKTLPQDLVLKSLRHAIEFCLSYGEDLLLSAEAIINASKETNQSCVSFTHNNDICQYLTPRILELGVKTWHLSTYMRRELVTKYLFRKEKNGARDYFTRLRNNEGMHELIRVLFGAVQICTGTLSARRQSELIDLCPEDAIDEVNKNLIFLNRKSGMGDLRKKEARPIPEITIRLIKQLVTFQERLVSIGVANTNANLFAYPHIHTGVPVGLNSPQYNGSIDIFCDYFEMPLNEHGERYYVRQHQLRRFFAMIFFWGGAFGGMDSLRWYLGHTDVEHLYHYITESTPGYILRATKAHYGTEIVKSHPEDVPKLADIIEKHFGTRHFSVLDSEELDGYIEELLYQGTVEIEPIFFDGPDGKSYRIAIKVSELHQDNTHG